MSKQCPLTGDPCDRAECALDDYCADWHAHPKVNVILVERPPSGPETYLGDGLYASFDGGMIKLRAPRDGGDHEVYMEANEFHELIEFAKRTPFRVLVR